MKKILVSILVIFILTNILCFYNTFAQTNSIDTYSIDNLTTNSFSLTQFNLKTNEIGTYSLSTASPYSNSHIDTIEGCFSNNDLIDPNYIIGDDNRYTVDVNSYPYNCIGVLETRFADNWYATSTAFQVADYNMLITAGHAVYSEEHGKPVEIRYWPAFDVNVSSHPVKYIYRAFAPDGWTKDFDYNYDWAILFTENAISNNYLGLRRYTPEDTAGRAAKISGYPRINEGNVTNNAQYCAEGKIISCTETEMRHDIDMNKGQSGAPIYETDNGKVFVLGVNTKQVKTQIAFITTYKNYGVRFSDDFFNAILELRDKY